MSQPTERLHTCECGREYKIVEQRHSWRDDDEDYKCECGLVVASWGGGLSCSVFLVDDKPGGSSPP